MKKNRIFWASAVIAALTLTACTDQTDFNQVDLQNAAAENAPGAIQFGTYLGENTMTRANGTYSKGTITNAVNTDNNSLKAASFGVFAYYTQQANWTNTQTSWTPNFMYNTHITWDDASGHNYWTYSPVKYWPNGIDAANANEDPSNTATQKTLQKVSFFAYAPFAANHGTLPLGTPYAADGDVFGTIPVGTDGVDEGKYLTTTNYNSIPTSATGGVVGMTSNLYAVAPWVNYYFAGTSALATEAVDLLWGLRGQYTYDETDNSDNTIKTLGTAYNTDLSKQSVKEKVRFLFKHALAKVGGNVSSASTTQMSKQHRSGLKVVLDVDANSTDPGMGSDNQNTYLGQGNFDKTKTLVTIKSVKIQDGKSASDDTENAITDKVSDFNTYGWFNLATGQWKSQGINYISGSEANGSPLGYNITVPSGTYTLHKDIAENSTNLKNYSGTAAWQATNESADGYTGGATGVTPTERKDVFADKTSTDEANDIPALVLIPSGDEPQTIYITVDYIVRTADQNLNTNSETTAEKVKAYTEVEQIISNEVKLKGLEANKYYTLVMHLGLTSVKLEAVVSDWAPSTGSESDENGETTSGGTEEDKAVWLPSNVVNTTTIYADAGTTHKKVTVADTAEEYVITLTGLGTGSKLSAVSDKSESTISDENIKYFSADGIPAGTKATDKAVPAGGYATVTVKLTPNLDDEDFTSTITVNETNATTVPTYPETKVEITQQAAVVILTPAVTSVPWNSGAFDIAVTHLNGETYKNSANQLSDATITVKDAAGTNIGTVVPDNGKITITPTNNTTDANRNIIVTVTLKGGSTATTTIVQGASTANPAPLSCTLAEKGTGYHITKAAGNSETLIGKLDGVVVSPYNVEKVSGDDEITWETDHFHATDNTGSTARSTIFKVTYTDAASDVHTGTITVIQQANS